MFKRRNDLIQNSVSFGLECENKTYGENCSNTCGRCRNSVACNNINGTCPDGCDPGWQSTDKCDVGM